LQLAGLNEVHKDTNKPLPLPAPPQRRYRHHASADYLHTGRNHKTVLCATMLHLLTFEDTDESTADSIHASITVGAPDIDQRAERRHADALELMALRGPAFLQAQRDAHLDVKTISPGHHYATSAAFKGRTLHCIRNVPYLTTTHAINSRGNVTSNAEIYRILQQSRPWLQASQVQPTPLHSGRPWPRRRPDQRVGRRRTQRSQHGTAHKRDASFV
jgi:hypothetical protein